MSKIYKNKIIPASLWDTELVLHVRYSIFISTGVWFPYIGTISLSNTCFTDSGKLDPAFLTVYKKVYLVSQQ